MITLFIVLHVLFCVFLILVILLQTGKGAGIGAAFGGGSQTVFGPRGAGSFIGKLTGGVAAAFMITSIVLAYMSTSRSSGVEDRVKALTTEKAKSVESVDLGESAAPPKKAEEAKPTPVAPAAEAVGQPEGAAPVEGTPPNTGEAAEGATPEGKAGGDEAAKPASLEEKAPSADVQADAKPAKPKKAAQQKPKEAATPAPEAPAEPAEPKAAAPEPEEEPSGE